MVKFSLRDLFDRINVYKTANVKYNVPDSNSGNSFISNILDVEGLRSAVTRKLKSDYANNKIYDLVQNISDPVYVNSIQNRIAEFVAADNAAKINQNNPYRNHPKFLNREDEELDNLRELLVDLSKNVNTIVTQTTSLSGTQFSINCDRYMFQLTSEEEASLDNNDRATLSVANLEPETRVLQSSIYMSDSSYGPLYDKQPHPVYTGVDMRVIFMTPDVITQNITMKVITYSIHSGLIPIKTLGRKVAKGFAEGDTNIAGTIIATLTVNDPMFNMQPLNYAVEGYAKRTSDIWRTYLLPDQLPRFDIVLLFSNEYGFSSAMSIFGVKFTDVGSVMSMSDSEIEVTYTYSALDISPLKSIAPDISNDTGTISTFDISSNNEYLYRRELAYSGKSQHRSIFEVGANYAAIDRRSKEVYFNRLRMAGMDLSSIYLYQKQEND